jgi:hypothetical protein
MPSGLTATTPDDLVLNVAVLYVGGSIVGTTASGTKFGLSKGGLDFDPGRKDREIEFDGKRAPIAQLEYPIDYDARIKGKIIQFGSEQIAYLEPGATLNGDEYTPKSADTLYAEGDYLEDVMAVWVRGNGGLFVVKFPVARVVMYKVDSKDKQEAEISIDLKAFLALDVAVADTSAAPYTIQDVAA